jgi:hypothetical protein
MPQRTYLLLFVGLPPLGVDKRGVKGGSVRRSGGLPTHVLPPPCGTGQGCEGDLTGPDRESASIRGWSDYPQGRIDTYVPSASDGACRSALRREEGDQRQQL